MHKRVVVPGQASKKSFLGSGVLENIPLLSPRLVMLAARKEGKKGLVVFHLLSGWGDTKKFTHTNFREGEINFSVPLPVSQRYF